MQCRVCPRDVPETATACPACGACVNATSGSATRLRADGGRDDDSDVDDPPSAGESPDDAARPSTGDRTEASTGDAGTSSTSDAVPTSPGDHGSPGGAEGAAPPGTESPTGSVGTAGEESVGERVRDVADRLPLAAGGFIGAVAFLVPYVVITIVTFVAADRGDPVSVAADMFFTVATLGAGQRFVDGFVSVSSITDLSNVSPADYPSVEAELEAAIALLQASPDAALLLLYVAGPWVLYLGGRYLSRHYALDDTPVGHAIAGVTVAVGTLPVLVVLGLAFSPPNLLPSLLLFGIGFPAVLGAVGGLSVYVFRRESVATSKLTGWLGVLLGVLITFVLSPWLPYPLDLAQRMSVSAMVFLDVASAAVGFSLLTALTSVLVVATAVVAGFARSYLAGDDVETPADGARTGASVVLGYVGAVALLGVAVPLSTIVIGVPFGAASAITAAQPTVTDYLRIVLFGGIVFPLLFCAAGGYLAARQRLAD